MRAGGGGGGGWRVVLGVGCLCVERQATLRRVLEEAQQTAAGPTIVEVDLKRVFLLCLQASLQFYYGKRHRSRSTPLRQQKRFIAAFELRVSILHPSAV